MNNKMQTEDKKHWYDGWIYSAFIAPNQRNMFIKIINAIPENSNIIDIACGTGEFSLLAAKKMKKITGIDLSSSNIADATKRGGNSGNNNLDFIHLDATKLSEKIKDKYDYSLITFALHEIPHNLRLKVINEMKSISDNIIIGDYTVPQPLNLYGAGVRIIEFFAGIEHYRGYKSFNKYGGIKHYTEQSNLEIYNTISAHKGHSEIVFCRGI